MCNWVYVGLLILLLIGIVPMAFTLVVISLDLFLDVLLRLKNDLLKK